MCEAGYTLLVDCGNITEHQVAVEVPVNTLNLVLNACGAWQVSADAGKRKRSTTRQGHGHIGQGVFTVLMNGVQGLAEKFMANL
ncbi:hypothetical protein EMIT091MI3_130163 [Kosakonia quasisacchari]